MTLAEVEERLRRAVVKRETRSGTEHTLAGNARDVVVELLAELERARLYGVGGES